MDEREREERVIDLGVVFIVTTSILAVLKTEIPKTLNSNEVPVLQIHLVEGQPIFIPYETNDERDADYNLIMERVSALRY